MQEGQVEGAEVRGLADRQRAGRGEGGGPRDDGHAGEGQRRGAGGRTSPPPPV